MAGQLRRNAPPRISIGDAELGRRGSGEDQQVYEGNTLVGGEGDVSVMEQRYAEALQDAREGKNDRDELAKAEGVTRFRPGAQDDIVGTPDTDATSFDWDEADSSDEEEAAAATAAREEELHDRHKHNIKRAKRLRKVYLACMRISRPVRTFGIALLGGSILAIPAIVVFTRFRYTDSRITDNVKVWSLWLMIVWVSSCLTSIVVDAIPWAISYISIFLTGLYPAAIKSKVTIFDGAKFWLKFLLITVWAWVSLSVLSDSVFKADYLDYFKYVLRTTQSLFGSAVVLYVEKLCVQAVKSSFHQNALKDRIEENARALWALDKLAASKSKIRGRGRHFFGHGRAGSNFGTPAQSRPGSRMGSPEMMTGGLHPNGKNGEAIVDVPLMPRGDKHIDRPPNLRHRSKNSLALGEDGIPSGGASSPDHFKGHRTGKFLRRRANSKTVAGQLTEALTQATLKDKSREQMQTAQSAQKLARRLFEGLGSSQDVLEPKDFEPYFATKQDAEVAFALFDKDGNGDISKKEMRSAVQRIFRERKALKASLKDMGSAVKKLDGVLLGVCLIIILFIFFLIFNRQATVNSLTSISTIVAALSFIFSNAASTLFNSMIFIFSTQPYSIGDLVFIDSDPLIVKEFGLMSTVFERVDGQYIIAPNSVLSTSKHILNVRRSGAMWETTNIQVAFDTPLEALNELRSKMRQYVQDNSREWGGGLDINFNTVSNQNSIDLIVAMQHKGNWQDWGGRWNRRTGLMRYLKTVLDELGVTYALPIQPVQMQLRAGSSANNGVNSFRDMTNRLRRGSNSSGNSAGNGNNNGFNLGSGQGFLHPDALGNAGKINAGQGLGRAESTLRRSYDGGA